MAKILVIDDSKTIRDKLKAYLASKGHVVHELEFFVDLALILKKKPPDLIILDLEMPGFSGLNLGLFVRNKCGSNIPIIIYSSEKDDIISTVVDKLGKDKTFGVSKQSPISDLYKAINSLLV